MPTMIAIHEIHRGRDVIAPKKKFVASEKDAETLLAAGAAELCQADAPSETGETKDEDKAAAEGKGKGKAKGKNESDDNLTE